MNGIYLILSGGQGPEFLRNWVLRVETKQDYHAADSCINCKWLKILKRFFFFQASKWHFLEPREASCSDYRTFLTACHELINVWHY